MTTNAIIPAPRPVGRPKKPLDHQKVQRLPEVLPKNPIEALEALLIFDARMLDRETQQELIRILPQLVHVRHAWKAHFLERGCPSCPKADERFPIAARMRLRGFTWDDIYEIIAPKMRTPQEKKAFRNAVHWKLEHPHARERKRNAYAAGGFCVACQGQIIRRMRARYRELMSGRDLVKELATFKDALCLSYNAAQRLFNGDD